MTTLPAALRALRLERGLSQAEAGRRLGWTQQQIAAIESGRLHNIEAAAERLNKLLAIYGKRCRIVIEETS
jgi:transcriptional regulator with XRE-family HTH domain